MKEGIVVINKPEGLTSHDVVACVRRRFNMKRVGHAGTLDPMATGVLVVLLGKATKLFETFLGFEKRYRATMILGTTTDTADTQGKILERKAFDCVTKEKFETCLEQFRGEIDQIPPMYSAIKVKGKRLYALARQGIEVKREARKVNIYHLECEEFDSPNVKIVMECSKGTYVRQIAVDIGEALGCGGCISKIQRTKVGKFSVDNSIKLEDLDESHIRHWQN